jgi:hypothetical protein
MYCELDFFFERKIQASTEYPSPIQRNKPFTKFGPYSFNLKWKPISDVINRKVQAITGENS